MKGYDLKLLNCSIKWYWRVNVIILKVGLFIYFGGNCFIYENYLWRVYLRWEEFMFRSSFILKRIWGKLFVSFSIYEVFKIVDYIL